MRVFYSLEVEGDLDAIVEYIATDSPRRAVRFIRKIYAAIERIGDGPQLYQLRPDIGPGARLAVVGRYVILFRVAADAIYVERVVQGSRNLPMLFQ